MSILTMSVQEEDSLKSASSRTRVPRYLIEDAEDRGGSGGAGSEDRAEADRADDLQEAGLAGAPVADHTQIRNGWGELIHPGQEDI